MIRTAIINAIRRCLQQETYGYIDTTTFRFEFGEGEFADSEGDSYFYHIEYHIDTSEWVFEEWYTDEVHVAELTIGEENYIKAVVKELL